MSPKDICKAINILRKKRSKGVFNIASGKSTLLRDIAIYICKKFKKKCSFKNNKTTFLVANINKLKKLGFISKENFYKNLNDIIKTANKKHEKHCNHNTDIK